MLIMLSFFIRLVTCVGGLFSKAFIMVWENTALARKIQSSTERHCNYSTTPARIARSALFSLKIKRIIARYMIQSPCL
jgi:hypothetical protein